MNQMLTIDHFEVPIEGESNLLEVIRKAHIDLPTFCYHSEISVYGACRMCMVEVEGMGIVPACSTEPKANMIVKTDTGQIRAMRRVIVELMLASHDQNCTVCPKSVDCRLQKIAKQLGVEKVRFRNVSKPQARDISSHSIVRDPGKCVLCGDCVRVCGEIQGVGVLDFANRGAEAKVTPCFNKGLGEVECVNCGQCVKICPVGALMPKFQINEVWDAIHNPDKHVIVQIAPAVRVAIGEYFGYNPGVTTVGQMVTALKMMGFDQVYDSSFAADLTVIEEGNEFLDRYTKRKKLPQFTSCCPAWVKFAEQYYPEMLSNLSSCKSPQQMFGALAKDKLSTDLGIARKNIVCVSVMPCTAKKFEAKREEFAVDDNPDVDFVLTTQELCLMIKERGIDFSRLNPSSFDMPFGFYTGAGVIFGTSGGVSEAVLRYAADKLGRGLKHEFHQLRYGQDMKAMEIEIGGINLRLAVVSGLANTRKLMDDIRSGKEKFDLVEVMACCGGCINGGGQPAAEHGALYKRSKGLYDNDKMLQFHNASENHFLRQIYDNELENEHKAHALLHTNYHNRKRIDSEDIMLTSSAVKSDLELKICFGTSCFLRGAQKLYNQLMEYVRENGLEERTQFTASFCSEHCKRGPVLAVNGVILERCDMTKAKAMIEQALKQ